MSFIEQLAVSFFATAAFGILFNVPGKNLVQCGFVGLVGWLVYLSFTMTGIDAIPATLIASFVVTMISHVFAKKYRTPIIIFNVSGIIPLVPGGMAYDAMRQAVGNQYDIAVQLGVKAAMISGAIAMGLVFSEVIYQVMRRRAA
ncbi:threonine/serine exporter family protein [Paenibacillus thiaminolyticus]|uniref:threonine/serine exporter family protein n=1 Tax=Paenibacillus thiaminolyticus TaxID=49283 RepID=UPI00254279A4|nr:threonine/serine exporter family protein [Paenibacillus thiaminolyticus]WII37524.1 threonine/serine exporter family protein [Paenibacillus thiaminolyticus]